MSTPYYKKQLERGLIFQDFVYEILARHGIMTVAYGSRLFQQRLGENKARMEIKFDDKLAATGNLWIETAEKSSPQRAEYVASGIQRECVEYVIGNYDELYRFSTKLLVRMWKSGRYLQRENGLKTSLGFLLPRDDAVKFATQIIKPNCAAEVQSLLRSDEEASKEADALMRQMLQKARVDPNQGTLFPVDGNGKWLDAYQREEDKEQGERPHE
jgi:hypothetical protein